MSDHRSACWVALQDNYVSTNQFGRTFTALLENIDRLLDSSTVTSITCLTLLQPSGHYMYHQFNTQQFYVQPIQCIYVFCVDLRTNSDYFPIRH